MIIKRNSARCLTFFYHFDWTARTKKSARAKISEMKSCPRAILPGVNTAAACWGDANGGDESVSKEAESPFLNAG